ncbi:Mu-like prophage FluMu protein [gamma proteobacterium IMCC1989]|nr:Mu-like prophage FluMu protein [gamma proteobacterium IMCC1989]
MALNKRQQKKQDAKEKASIKNLSSELAGPTTVRNLWGSGSVASGLTPQKLANILKAASEGDTDAYLTLAEEMEERDPHYSSVLRTRKLAVSSLPVTVVAGGDDSKAQKIAEDIQQLIDAPDFGDLVDDALDALGKGYSVNEIIWDRSGAKWEPKEYRWRDPRFFMFHHENAEEMRIVDESDPANGLPMPPYKFVVHKPRLKSGLVLRGGLARLVALSYICKMYGIKDWVGFLEIYGIPLRIGKYGQAASKEDKDILKTAVSNIGSDAAAILPDSMVIEFEQITQAAGASEVFARMVEWIDRQISKAVLGQTASSEGTPGKLGNEDSQESVRQDLIAADAKQLANTINRDLIRPYIDINYGPQDVYPRVIINIPEKEDLTALAANLEKLVPLGLKVSMSEVRTKLGLSEPGKDTELLGVPASTPTVVEEPAANRAINRAQSDDIDLLAADLLDEWEPQAATVTDPILAAVQGTEDYDELAELLPQLLEQADLKKLTESLAKAGLMAYGDGVEGSE